MEENVKLVPPDGVYAVNIESEGQFEKAMIAIKNWGIENSYLSEKLKIRLHILENHQEFENREAIIYFHKKISNLSADMSETFSEKNFQREIKEIAELIF
jgi:FAD synthase